MWIRILLGLLVVRAVLAAPSGPTFSNPQIGLQFKAPAEAILVTDPARLDEILKKGSQVSRIDLEAVGQAKLGLQFLVTWKNLIKKPFTPNINLLTEALPSPINDNQYLEANLKGLGASMQDMQLVSRGKSRQIGGRKFFILEWKATMGTGRAHIRNYLRVNPKRKLGYVITLTDLAERKGANFPKLEKLLGGFQFSD